jgi:hypothetical protein
VWTTCFGPIPGPLSVLEEIYYEENYVDIGGKVIVHAKLQRDLVVTLCCYSHGVLCQTTQIKVLKSIKYQLEAIKVISFCVCVLVCFEPLFWLNV